MALEKQVEWSLNVTPEEGGRLLRSGLASMGATFDSDEVLSISATTPRSMGRNRWAAKWRIALAPSETGTVATVAVEMTGSKHKALLDELAGLLGEVIDARTEPLTNFQAIKQQQADRDAAKAEQRAEQAAAKAEQRAEQAAAKAEQRAEQAAAKAEQRAEQVAAQALPAEASAAGSDDVLEVYKVRYLGGLPDFPKAKSSSAIELALTADAFRLSPTPTSQKWWRELTIQYDDVVDVEIVGRVLSTAEGLLGGVNSRQLNQDNNIHITFVDTLRREVVLRLEMLSGFSVMGQAAKCREFEDRLRTLGIRQRFRSAKALATSANADPDIPDQIAKLALLRDQGILTPDEFEGKKRDLLARL